MNDTKDNEFIKRIYFVIQIDWNMSDKQFLQLTVIDDQGVVTNNYFIHPSVVEHKEWLA